MGRSTSNPKEKLIATRVTRNISDLISSMAYREGLSVSEWVRNLIISELKRNDVIPNQIREPKFLTQ